MATLGEANVGGRMVPAWLLDTPANDLDRVVSTVSTLVRPNLLDNWYFGRPVNQRGQTSYSADWIYTIDRWQTSENSTLTVNNGSVSLTGSYIFEPLEEIVDALKGKTVTVSLLFSTGELEFATGVVPTTWSGWSSIVKNSHVGLQGIGEDSSRLWLLITDSAKNILAAKLELGPTQTLAHQENGVWVLNEVPEYGEQLRRCQRYYIKYDTIKANGYISNAAKSYYMPIFLPEALRTTPTILGTPKIRVRFNGGYSSKFVGGTFTAPDSWGVTVISANAVTLAFNVNTAVDPNNIPVSIEVEGLELFADL